MFTGFVNTFRQEVYMVSKVPEVGRNVVPQRQIKVQSIENEKEEAPINAQSISWSRMGFLGAGILFLSLFLKGDNVNSTIIPGNKDYNSLFNILGLTLQEEENIDYASSLRELKGFEQREKYLQGLIKTLNPQLLSNNTETTLDLFNKKNNLSLKCMGIRKDPYEFVFLDERFFLGKNKIPVRIALSLDEITNVKSENELFKLLEQKLVKHKEELKEQYAIWERPYEYDFPHNSGSCMFALTLSGLSGMESDLIRSLEMYTKYYGMSADALCIDNIHRDELDKLLKENDFKNLPKITQATKAEILDSLEQVLKKAIDDKKSMLMFHYLAHGSNNSKIWASDGPILPKEIAERISRSYKGSPLCSQIDITIWAGSCYSGRQLDGIKKFFEDRKNIPVKNLRVITESTYTTAGASTTPDNASIVSDLMTDNSGPLDYFRSWYREYLSYKGITSGNYLEEIRFADLMTRYETFNGQDSQGFHYYNDLINNKTDGKYFTSAESNDSPLKVGRI